MSDLILWDDGSWTLGEVEQAGGEWWATRVANVRPGGFGWESGRVWGVGLGLSAGVRLWIERSLAERLSGEGDQKAKAASPCSPKGEPVAEERSEP